MHTENNNSDHSILKTLRTEGGFTVPARYFETMHRQITEQTTLLESEKYFSVPDGYFDQLQTNILAKTTRKKSVIQFLSNRSLVKYTAAAIVLILSTLVFLLTTRQQQLSAQNMSDDDIIQYLEEEGTRELSISEVSFAIESSQPINPTDDHYLINTVDEQLIIDEL